MREEVIEDLRETSALVLIRRPQSGIVVEVALSTRFRWSFSLQLNKSPLHLELQVLQPVQKRTERWVWESKTAI